MKKSLVIISFAFIFLLSMSIVSAGFWDWLNGDATRKAGDFSSARVGSDGSSLSTFAGTREGSSLFTRRTTNGDTRAIGSTEFCPRGWSQIFAVSGGKETKCCVPRPKDLCPNLDGVQTTIPAGYVLENGKCVVSGSPGRYQCPDVGGGVYTGDDAWLECEKACDSNCIEIE